MASVGFIRVKLLQCDGQFYDPFVAVNVQEAELIPSKYEMARTWNVFINWH